MKDPGDVGDRDERLAVESEEGVAGLEAGFLCDGIVDDGLDLRGMIGGEGEADGFGIGHGIDPLLRNFFLLFAVDGTEGVADLMAVDAALDDFAIPVEFALVLSGEGGELEGIVHGHGLALFAGEGVFVRGVVLM